MAKKSNPHLPLEATKRRCGLLAGKFAARVSAVRPTAQTSVRREAKRNPTPRPPKVACNRGNRPPLPQLALPEPGGWAAASGQSGCDQREKPDTRLADERWGSKQPAKWPFSGLLSGCECPCLRRPEIQGHALYLKHPCVFPQLFVPPQNRGGFGGGNGGVKLHQKMNTFMVSKFRNRPDLRQWLKPVICALPFRCPSNKAIVVHLPPCHTVGTLRAGKYSKFSPIGNSPQLPSLQPRRSTNTVR